MNEFFLKDLFHTFQGEGRHAGRRALFVRMPFCNLKCTWCDTSFNSYTKWSLKEFLEFIALEPTRFAVVTGGEPTMHKHTPLVVKTLKEHGFEVAIETNGHFPIPEGVDFVTCSPKRFGEPKYFIHPEVLPKVSEFKYVVDREFDWSILERHHRSNALLSLSPEYENMKESVEKITEYIQKNPQWKLSLQTHKWIGVP